MTNRPEINIFIAPLVYGGWQHASCASWATHSCMTLMRLPGIGEIMNVPIDRAPVWAARNYAAVLARETLPKGGANFLCMIDADTTTTEESANFLPHALQFAATHDGPCVVSAPAKNAKGEVCVHKVVQDEAGTHHGVLTPAAECAGRKGFERAIATGCALMLIDMRVFDLMPPPWFRVTFTDEYQTEVKFWEDVTFTADLGRYGVPLYVDWDCRAGHAKETVIGW